jgi:hypothetical protein
MKNAVQNGGEGMPSPSTPQYAINPETTEAVKKTSEQMANKYGTGPLLWNRYQNSLVFDGFLKSPPVREAMNELPQWSGYFGKAKVTKDMFTNEDEFLRYKSFTDSQLPILITGGLKFLEGMPTTDNTVKEGKKFFDLAQNNIGKNPQAAANYLYQGLNFISAESEAIKKQAEPFFQTEAAETRLGDQQKAYDAIKKQTKGKLSPDQINQIIASPQYQSLFPGSQPLNQGSQMKGFKASNGRTYSREELAAIAGIG